MSEKDFVSVIVASLNQIESRLERLVKLVRSAIRSVSVDMSIDPVIGSPGVSVSFKSGYNETMLGNVMGLLGSFSEKRNLMVVFDEFQEVGAYKQAGFEKRLRAIIQQHDNISYFFCGSQRHILTEIFTSKNRAFYKLAQSYPLAKIRTDLYIPWAQKLFLKTLKLILITGGREIFYADALQAVDLKAGSQVTRSLEKLMADDIVLRNDHYAIQDVMFKKWIQTFLLKS